MQYFSAKRLIEDAAATEQLIDASAADTTDAADASTAAGPYATFSDEWAS